MEALYILYGLELNMCVGIWSDRQFSLSHDFYVELVRSISVYFVLLLAVLFTVSVFDAVPFVVHCTTSSHMDDLVQS